MVRPSVVVPPNRSAVAAEEMAQDSAAAGARTDAPLPAETRHWCESAESPPKQGEDRSRPVLQAFSDVGWGCRHLSAEPDPGSALPESWLQFRIDRLRQRRIREDMGVGAVFNPMDRLEATEPLFNGLSFADLSSSGPGSGGDGQWRDGDGEDLTWLL